MLSREIIPQRKLKVKSSLYKRISRESPYTLVDVTCPSCAKKAVKEFRYVKQLRCSKCNKKHILKIYGLSRDEIVTRLNKVVSCEIHFMETIV